MRRTEEPNDLEAARRTTFFLFLVPAALFLGVFWPSFDADARFSYRDVAYYYYPLFEQIQNEWNAGRLPLWDPFENLGQPLAGNPATAVFYPGKAIFFLASAGIVDFSTCFKAYLFAHLALAFVGVYSLARRLTISRAGAFFAGVSFAFSGQILFQYSNVIYLVGAAWLPLIIRYGIELVAAETLRRKLLATLALSAVDALAILGGEPQIVYLATIGLAAFACFAPRTPGAAAATAGAKRRVAVDLIFLVVGAAATGLLAAVQILPSLETIGRSERAAGDVPRSLWEIPTALRDRSSPSDAARVEAGFSTAGLLCDDLENRGQSRSTYRFSVGPWRWLEYFFPNVGGRQFPRSGRWFSVFPEEVAVWTPTLYFGVVPMLLALSAARFRRPRGVERSARTSTSQAFRRWATWLVAVATLAALGGYGAVWAFRFVRAQLGNGSVSNVFQNGDPVGGLYWLLNLTLPKFVEFRYPAKLLTLSALGFSVLAGFGWDDARFSRRFRIATRLVFAVAVAGLLFVSLRGESLFAAIRTVDPLYGPFQPRLAFESVRGAFAQTALVLAASSALFFFWEKSDRSDAAAPRRRKTSALCAAALLSLTALDVGLANSWTITTAPRRLFERRGEISQTVENERLADLSAIKSDFDPQTDAAPPIRVYRFPVWFPASFRQKSSAARTDERVLWDALTLFPKYPFSRGIATIDARGTASDAEYATFVDALAARSAIDADAAFLGTSFVVGPPSVARRLSPSNNGAETDAPPTPTPNVALKKIAATPKRIELFRDGRPERLDGERAEIVAFEPNRIVYYLETRRPADVVFAEQYWPDWTATAIPLATPEDKDALLRARFDADATRTFCKERATKAIDVPIEPAFRFLRKISIPRGSYCVVATYRPRRFYLGAAASAASWAVVAALFAARVIRRRRFRRTNRSI